jgi:SAM-dependent methyltransferase
LNQTSAQSQASGVDIANVDMAAAWDGPEGDHWADNSERYESTSARYGEVLLNAAAISGGQAVLDVGCGTGGSTREAGRRADGGAVLGLDLSRRMLARAREIAASEGLDNVRFEHGDAQVYPFAAGSFDVAMSLFGSMFFDEPTAAFTNIRGALRPGGHLALLVWRDLASNEWLTAVRAALAMGRDLPAPPAGAAGPFCFADPAFLEKTLKDSGFVDVNVVQADESMRFGDSVADAYSFVSTFGITRGLTNDLDDRGRAAALDALKTTLAEHETEEGVLFGASAWLATASAGERT